MAHVRGTLGSRVRAVVTASAVLAGSALLPAVFATSAASAAVVGRAPAGTTAPCATAGVTITKFAFVPPTVVEGLKANLDVTVTNCTVKAFAGSLETYGVLVCEVLDPVTVKVAVPAHGAVSEVATYVAPHCTGVGTVHGKLFGPAGHLLSSRTASLHIVPPPAA